MHEVEERSFMEAAIARAREGMAAGQSPFGACIVRDSYVVSCEHNRVWQQTDCTAHAEIVAIRVACRVLGTIDLGGCTIYSTTEPCPMCFSAIHWSKMSTIVFGTRIRDAQEAGFGELTLSNEHMKQHGGSRVLVRGDFMRDEAAALFKEWMANPARQVY